MPHALPISATKQFASLRLLACVILMTACAGVWAQSGAKADPKTEAEAAWKAASTAAITGPADIVLADQATLKITEGQAFVPAAEAGRLLQSMGNRGGSGLLGMVVPVGKEEWAVIARHVNAGYIKDDDAKDWKADELLKSLREGTEESNKERKTRGIAEMDIVGWVQAPTYDAAAHRLVWSLSSKDKGAPDNIATGVNYNTYALGREGYISLNLVTSMKTIEQEKAVAHTLLAALNFNEGKRYADFNSSTDKVAEYGLAALIGGVAAKKLGLLAVAGVFLLKFWKLLLIGVVAIGALVAILARRKKEG